MKRKEKSARSFVIFNCTGVPLYCSPCVQQEQNGVRAGRALDAAAGASHDGRAGRYSKWARARQKPQIVVDSMASNASIET